MDISTLNATRSFALRVEQDVKDLYRDLQSGDTASADGLIQRLLRDSKLAVESIDAVDRRIRETLA